MKRAGRYSRIRNTFWSDPDIKRRLSLDQKALLLYYFTSPHGNMIGLYYLPLTFVADETGLSMEQVVEWTAGPLSEFVTYDPETEEILVHKAGFHQVDEELKGGDKRRKAVETLLADAKSPHLIRTFIEIYKQPWNLEASPPAEPEAPLKPLPSPFEGASSTTPARQDAPSKPLHCSSSAVTGSGSSPSLRSVEEPGASAVVEKWKSEKGESEPDPQEPNGMAPFVEPIRRYLWLGPDPPGSSWSLERELSIVRELRTHHSDEEVVGIMEGVRILAKLGQLGEDIDGSTPLTNRVVKRKIEGRAPVANLALHAWRKWGGKNGGPE